MIYAISETCYKFVREGEKVSHIVGQEVEIQAKEWYQSIYDGYFKRVMSENRRTRRVEERTRHCKYSDIASRCIGFVASKTSQSANESRLGIEKYAKLCERILEWCIRGVLSSNMTWAGSSSYRGS